MANRLSGVRLGRIQRQLLIDAPDWESTCGRILDPPDAPRSVQQTYLKASKRLAEVGLLDRLDFGEPTLVVDKRRKRPFFKDGRFWLHRDPRRPHIRRRVVVWRTPFGDAILLAFRLEFSTGRAIRWSDERVKRAEDAAAGRFPLDGHRNRLAQEERELRVGQEDALISAPGPVEYVPDFFEGREGEQRWRLAARAAHLHAPHLRSGRLLKEAIDLYHSHVSSERLEATVRDRPEPPRYRCGGLVWTRDRSGS